MGFKFTSGHVILRLGFLIQCFSGFGLEVKSHLFSLCINVDTLRFNEMDIVFKLTMCVDFILR